MKRLSILSKIRILNNLFTSDILLPSLSSSEATAYKYNDYKYIVITHLLTIQPILYNYNLTIIHPYILHKKKTETEETLLYMYAYAHARLESVASVQIKTLV